MDVDFDSSDHIYGVGYQCDGELCVGVMTKMNEADGSEVWEKVFTDAAHFERAGLRLLAALPSGTFRPRSLPALAAQLVVIRRVGMASGESWRGESG